MASTIYQDGHPFTLGVVGGAALLATMAGEYLMHNPAQAQDWNACAQGACRVNGGVIFIPLPATVVVLPGGATLDITLYQIIVLALGALILASALARAMRTTLARRLVLAVAAALLALTLVVFHAQAPMQSLVSIAGQCNVEGICQPQQRGVPYVPASGVQNGHAPVSVSLIDPFWFMAPAAALGLLTAGIAFLSAARR